jgi:quaternary ammonium compound-resistance protein SugE
VEPFSVLKVLFIAGIVGCAAGLKALPGGTDSHQSEPAPSARR